MKKYLFFLLPLVGLLLLGNCKKALGIVAFEVDDTVLVPMPATAGGGPVLAAVSVTTTAPATYAANKATADNVQEARPRRLARAVANPTTQNFDFLERVEVYISKDAAGTTKTKLAALYTVPRGQTTIELTPTDSPVDTYLSGSTYWLLITAGLAQPLPQNTTLRADARFYVRSQQ